MLHLFLLGLILGWGASIPIGPINLEMTRRNLQKGTGPGMFFGLGACVADVTYLILLCAGAFILLQHKIVLKVVGLVGAAILIWFGIGALRLKPGAKSRKAVSVSLWRNGVEGYLLTLLNPFTILFWASVSSQLAVASAGKSLATMMEGLGVIVGAVSWVVLLNVVLHFTRHKLSGTVMHRFNIAGGFILLLFAAFSIFMVFWK